MNVPADLRAAHARLARWLSQAALPLWWARGADFAEGGFFDRLGLDGSPTAAPKRVRVQARQAFVYGLAAAHGWMEGADRACRHGLHALAAMRRADGLYRLSEDRSTTPLDGMGELYDQAFALLGLATGWATFGDDAFQLAAEQLRRKLSAFVDPAGGYAEAPGLDVPLFANPNMHLFESFQAWRAISDDPEWGSLAGAQAWLAIERLIDPRQHVLFEEYDAGWRAPIVAGSRVIWPGHLYEWAYLLMRHDRHGDDERDAALGLIDVAEARGVDPARGVAIFALDGDLTPTDRGARLWSQTERLRALAAAGAATGEARYWEGAVAATATLERFLEAPTPGLWRDWMDEAGAFRDEPAPASSFYHIVGAIAELERVIAAAA